LLTLTHHCAARSDSARSALQARSHEQTNSRMSHYFITPKVL